MIDVDKIAEEFKTLFPKATLENHIAKLNEEVREVETAFYEEEYNKELADVILCCCAIKGLYPLLGDSLLSLASEIIVSQNIPFEVIDKEIKEKWELNKSSEWVYLEDKGVYKRVKKSLDN